MAAAWVTALGSAAASARGDDASAAPAADANAYGNRSELGRPPPRDRSYLQYGVTFAVEGVVSPGPICGDSSNPCILGSGAGVGVRVGWRATERLYIGGAYEFSKQDASTLYLLGILQQARFEIRSYFPTDHSVAPFFLAAAGLTGYGDRWDLATWGPALSLGGGIEIELSGGYVVGVSLAYRPTYLSAFVDSSTLHHDDGVAHLIGLELSLDAQEAL
jgi:hypothetical protein